MKPESKLTIKRVHMYCHEVTYSDKEGTVTGIIEESPEPAIDMLSGQRNLKPIRNGKGLL